MLKLLLYGVIIYFIGKWLYQWIQKTIPSDMHKADNVKGKKREESNFEINPEDVEDVNFTEIDEEEEDSSDN